MMADSETSAKPLPGGCEIFRAVKPSWVSDGHLLPIAFLRSRRDQDGLSVSSDRSRAGATYQRQRGLAALLTERVRSLDLALEVISDPTELDPHHALITGLPYPFPDPYSEDPDETLRAHQAAERLLSIATFAV